MKTKVAVRSSGTAYDREVPYRPSFGWVPEGEDVLYNSSDGVLGIGINLGNFSEKYGISPSEDWTVTVISLKEDQ